MKKQFVGTAFALLVMAIGAGAASAQTTFDNISGNSFSNAAAGTGNLPGLGSDWVVGERFTALSTGYIGALTLSAFGATSSNVEIYSDFGGNLVGPMLESLTVNGSTQNFSYSSGNYSSGATLTQGDSYWVVLFGPTAAVSGQTPVEYWGYMSGSFSSNTNTFQDYAKNLTANSVSGGTYGDGPVNEQLGMRIGLVSAVPEPQTWVLMLLGLGMLGFVARRTDVR